MMLCYALRVTLLGLLAARPAHGQGHEHVPHLHSPQLDAPDRNLPQIHHVHAPHSHTPRPHAPGGDAFDPAVVLRSVPSTVGLLRRLDTTVGVGDLLVFLPAGEPDCTGAVAALDVASAVVTVDMSVHVALDEVGTYKACRSRVATPTVDAEFEYLDGAELMVEEGTTQRETFLDELQGVSRREGGGARGLVRTTPPCPP